MPQGPDRGRLTNNTPTGESADYVAGYAWDGMGWAKQLGGPASLDAFARLRVSNPNTLFESKSLIDAQNLLFDDAETSGASTTSVHSVNRASVAIGVGDGVAGTRVRQSLRRPSYQSGKSHLMYETFIMGAAETGVTRQAGIFDQNNGVFLQQTPTGINWVLRSKVSGSVVDTVVPQADWSGTDFDDLDLSRAQIIVVDYEWLGTGDVRVGFVHNDHIMYVHTFHHANVADSVYMSTPNLPVRWEIIGDGTNGAATLECICSVIMSEGGADQPGLNRAVDRGIVALATLSNTAIYPLIAIRLQAGGLGATVRATLLSTIVTTAADYRWALILNPTVVGTALSFTAVANSGVEAQDDTTNATTITGGTILESGYASASQQFAIPATSNADYALGSKIDGTSDILVLAVQNISGAVESYFGTFGWLEQD